MISDFELLSQKVDELATLAHALRRENAGLRASLALTGDEKNALVQRMELARQRVAAVLARLPAAAGEAGADDDGEVDSAGAIGHESDDAGLDRNGSGAGNPCRRDPQVAAPVLTSEASARKAVA